MKIKITAEIYFPNKWLYGNPVKLEKEIEVITDKTVELDCGLDQLGKDLPEALKEVINKWKMENGK